MKRWYAIIILVAIIGVATWIFFILAGEGPTQEQPPKRPATQRTQQQTTNTTDTNETPSDNSTTKPKQDLEIVDLNINSSLEYFNYPSLTEQEINENTTFTRLMYLDDGLWNIFGITLLEDSLGEFLQKGFVKNSDNEPIHYYQMFRLPTNVTLNNFSDSTFREGNYTVGFNLTAKEDLFTYDLSFVKSINIANLTRETLSFLGNQYYVISADEVDYKLVLLETPYTFTLNSTQQVLINYPGQKPLLISIDLLEGETAFLQIDNKTAPRMKEGTIHEHGNMTLFIDEILPETEKENGSINIVISPTTMKLRSGEWITVNDQWYEDVRFTFLPEDDPMIQGFQIHWQPQKNQFVTYNESIFLPYFDSFRLSMSDWNYFDTELDEDPYVYIYLETRMSELLTLTNGTYQRI